MVKPSLNKISELLDAMGETSRKVLSAHIDDAINHEIFSKEEINMYEQNSYPLISFLHKWRSFIGPQYYHNSILSIERQIDILSIIGRPLLVYRKRKQKMFQKQLDVWNSFSKKRQYDLLSQPAWFSLNTTDSLSGIRLQLGFRNKGCAYWQQDQEGIGCYNCGYFAGCLPHQIFENFNNEQYADHLIKQFDSVLNIFQNKNLMRFDTVDIVGDGSFFNPSEIPIKAQDKIIKKISNLKHVTRLLVESQPQYIDKDRIKKILSILRKDQSLEIAVGLETTDPFIASFCINKGFMAEDTQTFTSPLSFRKLIETLSDLPDIKDRCAVQAYVLMKSALLTESECINDVINTINWVSNLTKSSGFSIHIKLEPTVVCYGSLLEVLNDTQIVENDELIITPEEGHIQRDIPVLHSPPSYWSVVEVLAETIFSGNQSLIRIGAREDMDIFKAIPAIYNGHGLSKIDPVLYNAVQKFNLRNHKGEPDIHLFIASVKQVINDPSFDEWCIKTFKTTSSLIKKLCEELDYEVRQISDSENLQHRKFINTAMINIVSSITTDSHIRKIADNIQLNWHSHDPILRQSFNQSLFPIVTKIIQQYIPSLSETDILIDQVQYVPNPPPTLRFEVNIKNITNFEEDDIWIILPFNETILPVSQNTFEEVERKWIIDTIPNHLLKNPKPIIQAYLSITKEEEVRVRRKVSKNPKNDEPYDYWITVKSAGGLLRKEYETLINKQSFENLINASNGKIVEKDRYVLKDSNMVPELNQNGNNYTIELDVYKGNLYGLYTAEVEFKSEEASRAFDAPEWFGLEVTLDKRFKNQSLASYGLSGIILQPHARYRHSIISLLSEELSQNIRQICSSFTTQFKIISFDELPLFIGLIRREIGQALWGCAALVLPPFNGEPNILVLLALTNQTNRPIIFINKNEHNELKNQYNKLKHILKLQTQKVGLRNDDTEKSFSEIIKRQGLLDNDILAKFEAKADIIHVISTTLEFDLGELQSQVVQNLKNGKHYKYYIPDLQKVPMAFPKLRANLLKFKEYYEPFKKSIEVYILPGNYTPYYHEIVIYQNNLDQSQFGFTYLEPVSQFVPLELIEIPEQFLLHTINFLKQKCSCCHFWDNPIAA